MPRTLYDTETRNAPDWCVCEHPDQQPINLFGWIHVTDVTECARCHRPPTPKAAT